MFQLSLLIDQETSDTGESRTTNGVEGIDKSSGQFGQDDTLNETVENEIDYGDELVLERQDMSSERQHVISEKESNSSVLDQVIMNDSSDYDVIVISD